MASRIQGITVEIGVDETREQLCRNILNALSVINYVPFDSGTIGNPALDLGDVLVFNGGQADGAMVSAITSMQVKIGGKTRLFLKKLVMARQQELYHMELLKNPVKHNRIFKRQNLAGAFPEISLPQKKKPDIFSRQCSGRNQAVAPTV